MEERETSRLTDAKPKSKSVFVSEPGPPSKVAAVDLDEFGNAKKHVKCESAEAASHWDERLWRNLH